MGRALLYLFAPKTGRSSNQAHQLVRAPESALGTLFWNQNKVNLSLEYLTLGCCILKDIAMILADHSYNDRRRRQRVRPAMRKYGA
jgi:hypothetical protein